MKAAGEAQTVNTANAKELIDSVAALVEVNRNVQLALTKVMDRQEEFAGQLKEQKAKLENTCNEINEEISSQLYAFDQMRSLYEK